MKTPTKEYIPRNELAVKWGCNESDIDYFVADGKLRCVIYMPWVIARPMSLSERGTENGHVEIDVEIAKDESGQAIQAETVNGFFYPYGFRVRPDRMFYQWFSTHPNPRNPEAAQYSLEDEEVDYQFFEELWFEHDEIKRFEAQQINNSDQPKSHPEKEISGKSETSYLNIIGAVIREWSRDRHPDSQKVNQSELIDLLLEEFPGLPGLSERNLKDKFSKALKATSDY